MATKSKTGLKTASVLAFERKLDPSDAQFFSGLWDDRTDSDSWSSVTVREKSVRGTISNRRPPSHDAAKLNAAIENPNLQTVDVAALPANADTLKVSFTLRVLGGIGTPSACNDAEYQAKLTGIAREYASNVGFGELGRRYAYNLANGRFLWRNRLGAEQVEVVVERLVQGTAESVWTFDAMSMSLREFSMPQQAESDLAALSDLVTQGLDGSAHVLLKVTAFVRLGFAQEVYPSQELILDKGKSRKSKTLYSIDGVAGIHSQKIGNAVRTIDTWHSDAIELGPIAVEPYGSVTTLGKACRTPADKIDFYSLLDNWLLRDNKPPVDQQHYVMATLIRGGVFGDAGKE